MKWRGVCKYSREMSISGMVSLCISYSFFLIITIFFFIISSWRSSIVSLFCCALSCVESECTFMLALFWLFPGFLGFSLSFNRSERGRVVRRAPFDYQELLPFYSIIIRFRFSSVFLFLFLSFMEILDSQIYNFFFLMFFIVVIITF